MKRYVFEYTQRETVPAQSEEEARFKLSERGTLCGPDASEFELIDVVDDEPQPVTQVIDLMAALKASLAKGNAE